MRGFQEHVDGWSDVHGGYVPWGPVRLWLALMHLAARPLLRVPPNVVTGVAVLVALASLAPAWAGGGWAALVALAVALSGVLDGLDGAVAVLAGRCTRWGFVLDSVADRVADAAVLVAFWLLGASAGWCVAAGVGLGMLEYTRARAMAGGMTELGVVTVGERPVRLAVAVVFLLAGAVGGPVWFDVGVALTAGLSLIGLVQLLVVVRRLLGD